MRSYIACIIFCLTSICSSFGQAYKYIGVTEGLSDRRVLSIQKDKTGFMWFLTYTGVDRYDGKNIKHYRLLSNDGYVSFYSDKNILKTDSYGNVWVIGSNGELFKYIPLTDNFIQIQLPGEIISPSLKLVKMTDFGKIWYCHKDFSYIYDVNTGDLHRIQLEHKHRYVTSVFQKNDTTFYLGSDDGICQTIIKNGEQITTKCLIPHELCQLPRIIYIHPTTNRLFAGSESDGLIIYDLTLEKMEKQYPHLKDFPITGFHPYEANQLLIPTRGAGVYRYDLRSEELQPQFYANPHEPNKMNGNNIRSLYIDEEQRIWMSVYARGITIYAPQLPDYKWYKNHLGNSASLNDDLVNAILEDSDGDIWFATNNGLSIYNPSENTWKHLFAWDNATFETMKNSIFLSLCEIEPGRIAAGGFMTGVYSVDKKSMTVNLMTPQSYKLTNNPNETNKYIRVIYRDKEGLVWTGGNNYLGCTDLKNETFKHYPIGNAITCIQELDSTTLLIGTGNGIYRLNRKTQQISLMRMPFASQQINDIYLHPNGDLFIGTMNSGLVVLRTNGEYEQYLYQISALLSNTINTIIAKSETELLLATEQNIVLFNNQTKKFVNWTDDQGLIKTNFNPRAGIHTSRHTFIFGSNMGAVEWSDSMRLPRQEIAPIIFDQILIENEHATSTTSIQTNIQVPDSISEIFLSHNQRNISLHASTINYHAPKYTYIQWKLDGRYNYWNKLGKENWLQFRDLPPGEYILSIQNIAAEDKKVLSERQLKIVVEPTFWETTWALLLNLMGAAILFAAFLQYIWMRKQQKESIEKDKFLIDMVNGIRTPLLLIRSAMNEVMKQDEISAQSHNYLQTACHSTDRLSIMTINLLNIEKMRKISKVHVEYHDVNQLIRKYIKPFATLVEHDNISIQFVNQEEQTLQAWVDTTKIELIFYNLMSNLIRQTTPGRIIYIATYTSAKRWGINICNSQELMDSSFASSDPDNSFRHMNKSLMDSELHLIDQLVKKHYGKMSYVATQPANYLFSISFPIKDTHYIKQQPSVTSREDITSTFTPLATPPKLLGLDELGSIEKFGYILLVSENSETLEFLNNALCKEWKISTARSTAMALDLIEEHEPDIIITSSSIPKWGEYDLCTILKSNINTSHIPIILMTSDDDKETIQNSFMQRADHYVTTPYELFVIQSILNNILENRRQLHDRLSKADQIHKLKEIKQANVEQEAKFLTEVKQVITTHIDDPDFNVDELCSLMGMSRTNLYNKIKSLTNQPLSALIRDARMKRAGEMLLSDKYNITEVCDLLGFSELKYFREVFKKFYGMTPSDYIKQHKE